MSIGYFNLSTDTPAAIISPSNMKAPVGTDHMIQCTFEGVPTPTVV